MSLVIRPQRLRLNSRLRDLVKETSLSVENLVLPLFVREGKNLRQPIASMPGHFQFSPDTLAQKIKEVEKLGIRAVILFGIPERKDTQGSQAYTRRGIAQQAIAAVKNVAPNLLVIADTCLCEYTSHGHCGLLEKNPNKIRVNNDATLEILAKTAVSQAQAGADIVAPSGMMDGMVGAIRQALDEESLAKTLILSYAVKYASSFYGPFRQAAEGAPQKGNRKSYQMDFANAAEALREAALDVEQGADMLMVKPALSYLDIVQTLAQKFPLPIAAYNVSGEYAMIKAAAERGWLDEKAAILETLTSIRRAGARFILTYHAEEAAKILS